MKYAMLNKDTTGYDVKTTDRISLFSGEIVRVIDRGEGYSLVSPYASKKRAWINNERLTYDIPQSRKSFYVLFGALRWKNVY